VHIAVLRFLLSILFGCASKPSKPTEPPPQKPGTSCLLPFPVMLFGGRETQVKAHERTLITTNVSSGMYYPEFKMIDSDAKQYSILKETSFERRFVRKSVGEFRLEQLAK
jgi:hypothetical protein